MAWRRARYSLFCTNNIILPKVGIGGSLHYLQGSLGTPFCYVEVPSIFHRGPRGPPIRRGWVHSIFHMGPPGLGVCPGVCFCKHFVAGREEVCRVPPSFCRVLSSSVRVLPIFYIGPLVLACVQVCVCVFARISLLVGRKCVGFPNFCRGPCLTRQGSLNFPHGSPGLCVRQAFRSWSGGIV